MVKLLGPRLIQVGLMMEGVMVRGGLVWLGSSGDGVAAEGSKICEFKIVGFQAELGLWDIVIGDRLAAVPLFLGGQASAATGLDKRPTSAGEDVGQSEGFLRDLGGFFGQVQTGVPFWAVSTAFISSSWRMDLERQSTHMGGSVAS